jgi:hypothetical protein
MYVVALAELATSVDAEAAPLAVDLGCTLYESRLLLLGGVPAVLLSTPERDRALALLGKVRGRGHGAIAFDASAVVSSAVMPSMRHFRLDDDAIVPDERSEERLPYDDLLVLVRASHRTRTDTESEAVQRSFSAGRAIMTGGLVNSKKVTRVVQQSVVEREQVLYLFRRSGATPFLLRESAARYGALGPDRKPSSLENFALTITKIRERAPGGAYDERLLAARKIDERVACSPGAKVVSTSSEAGVDLMAHLVALWFAKKAAQGTLGSR